MLNLADETMTFMVAIVIVPYSGYNLRGAISANYQISYLEVIFAIIKFANHSVTFCAAR